VDRRKRERKDIEASRTDVCTPSLPFFLVISFSPDWTWSQREREKGHTSSLPPLLSPPPSPSPDPGREVAEVMKEEML